MEKESEKKLVERIESRQKEIDARVNSCNHEHAFCKGGDPSGRFYEYHCPDCRHEWWD